MQLKRLIALSMIALGSIAASAAMNRAEGADAGRPFKGSAVGIITPTSPTTLEVDYVGNATHLGNFTRHEEIEFTGPGTFEGTIVFIAANGDELDLDLSGHFVSANDVVATYTFTGGTGRFAGATGTATATASTPDFVHATASFEGTIDY